MITWVSAEKHQKSDHAMHPNAVFSENLYCFAMLCCFFPECLVDDFIGQSWSVTVIKSYVYNLYICYLGGHAAPPESHLNTWSGLQVQGPQGFKAPAWIPTAFGCVRQPPMLRCTAAQRSFVNNFREQKVSCHHPWQRSLLDSVVFFHFVAYQKPNTR